MKKWLMLASLPLLLLAQQEAGAVMFKSVLSDPLAPDKGFTALFDAIPLDTNPNLYTYVGISIKFGSSVLLGTAKEVEQDDNKNVSPPPPANSLIQFVTYRDKPTLIDRQSIVNLKWPDPDTGKIYADFNVIVSGTDPVNGETLGFNLTTNTLTAFKESNVDIPPFSIGTCVRYQLQGQSASGCIPITKVTSVPIADSFLLVGIGLIALGIRSRSVKLS